MSGKPNLSIQLRKVIRSKRLHLDYQPQYDVENGTACGIEALARWDSKSGEAISPTIFIPIAERCGLIASLGEWVLEEACRTVAAWVAPDEAPTLLCVNVSALQISASFPDVVARVTNTTGFPAARLELEITESALIEDTEAVLDCLTQLKELGVRIAIDDFGTGYSSLNYLSRLPVDRLKLDQSLIRNITRSRRDVAIVRTVIGLGKELGFTVLAEGVETEGQMRILQTLGCQQVQGYLLARPAAAIESRLCLAKPWGMRPSFSCPPGSHPAILGRVSTNPYGNASDYSTSSSRPPLGATNAAVATGKCSTIVVIADRTDELQRGEFPTEAAMAATSSALATRPMSAFSKTAAAPRNLCANICISSRTLAGSIVLQSRSDPSAINRVRSPHSRALKA